VSSEPLERAPNRDRNLTPPWGVVWRGRGMTLVPMVAGHNYEQGLCLCVPRQGGGMQVVGCITKGWS
jgi:hypothetical protein